MAAPYTSVAVTGYNANPPADDGSATVANEIFWATIKTKLPDPLKTALESINTNIGTAFGKVVGGSGVTSTAISYAVQGGDQGKLVRATASGITVTTPDATAVASPFVFGLLNNSSGTITLTGASSQTIDGSTSLTIPTGGGTLLFTDGTNWFSTGIQGVLVGKQLQYGDIINGTIQESNGANAVTFSLKTLAGADPSATDPVVVCFRNTTAATGNYVYRLVTAATTLVLSSGSVIGTTSAIPFRLWLVLFDDAGTVRLGAINCLSGVNIYPLGQNPIASSTAEGGAGGADSAQVFYSTAAVTAKPYLILATATYESGMATAGAWNASPTKLRIFDDGHPLPGSTLQSAVSQTGAVSSGSTTVPYDDTIPQDTEGDQYLSQAITPASAANVFSIRVQGHFSVSANQSNPFAMSLYSDQDSTTNAVATTAIGDFPATTAIVPLALNWRMLAGTTSATTFTVRAGHSAAATTSFNGASAARKYGGAINSYLAIDELVA